MPAVDSAASRMQPAPAVPSPPATFRPLREIVQSQLLHDLLSRSFLPGQKLNETHLAQAEGVSRGPGREGLRALEGRALVRFVANRGAVVSRLSRTDVQEIYQIRIELEGLAARLGATRISDRQVARMRQLVRQMDASTADH